MKPASKNKLKLSNSLAVQRDIKKSFASPFRNEGNCLAKGIERAVIEINKLKPEQGKGRIRTDAKVICSQQAHYTMLNSTDWSGLGMENIIKVKTVTGSNKMDMEHLEEVLKECYAKKMPVASVVCTMAQLWIHLIRFLNRYTYLTFKN